MNSNLPEIAKGVSQSLTHELTSSRTVFGHPTLKGDASEEHWRQWFQKHLPRRYGVERACIIDSTGLQSDQIDVVIFDPQYTPVLYDRGGPRFLPAEGVYAVFEVKQTLTAGHIEAAIQKAASVRALHRTSAPVHHAGGTHTQPKEPFRILAGILALESTWTPPLGEPLVAALNAAPADGGLDFVFAALHGCCVREPAADPALADGWTRTEGADLALRFLLQFIQRLAGLGTVTAIDFSAYVAGLGP